MSVQAREWARGRVRKKLAAVLLATADYADKSGVAWVAQRTLANDLQCHRRTVIKDLNELEAARLIRRVRAHDDAGHRDRNFIVLAPNADDRGPMFDAADSDHPPEVVKLARTGHSADSYVTESPPRTDPLGGVLSEGLSEGLGGENGRLSEGVPARTVEREEQPERTEPAVLSPEPQLPSSTAGTEVGRWTGEREDPPAEPVDAVVVEAEEEEERKYSDRHDRRFRELGLKIAGEYAFAEALDTDRRTVADLSAEQLLAAFGERP